MADPHSITDHLAPSKKSARSDLIEADEDGYISSDFAGSDDDDDEVYSQIRDRIVSGAPKNKLAEGDESVASLDRLSTSEGFANSTSGHCSLTYGFIPKGCYNHPIKSGAILGSKIWMDLDANLLNSRSSFISTPILRSDQTKKKWMKNNLICLSGRLPNKFLFNKMYLQFRKHLTLYFQFVTIRDIDSFMCSMLKV